MSDLNNLYRAYSAVHSSEVSDQLNESRDLISDMQFNQLNSSDLQEVAEEILEEMFELSLDIEQSSDIIADILSEALKTSQSDLKSQKIDYIGEAFDAALENGHTVERFLGYRRAKKIQENFHNTSNEDRSSKRLHEALIAQERKDIKEGILSLVTEKTKDSSYLETNMKKRAENNEKARKDMENMGTSMKNPQLEEFSQIRKDWSGAYSSIYEKKMDAVGKEDGDIDNDGDKDPSDDYLANRRKAIGKAMGKKGDKKEVEEGYKELPKNKMFRKAGNLGRDAISTPIDPEKRQKAYDRSKKIVKTLNKANEEFEQIDELLNPKVNLPFGGDKITHNHGGAGAAIGGAAAAGLGAGAMALANKMKKKKEKKEEGKIQEVVALPALGAAAALGAAGGLASGIAGTVGAKMTRKAMEKKKANEEVQHKEVKFSEAELKKFEETINSWVD